MKSSTIHNENDINVLKNRITEFQGLKNNIILKIKRIRHNIESMKHNSSRCDVCKDDIHRASYSRHLKSKKHLESTSQNETIIVKKNPIKRVV